MFDDRVLRRILPYTSIAVIVALAYAGWILAARYRAARAVEQTAKAAKARADEKIVKAYGDGHIKIVTFYASPATLKRGQKGLLCYGVANAKEVRIDPLTEVLHPSLSRCLEVKPKADTQYTLTAQDGEGNSETRTLELSVR